MTGLLLDTSFLSERAPGRTKESPSAQVLISANARSLYVPAIAVAEIEQGICKLRRAGGVERAVRLTNWLDGLIADFGSRVLSFDAAVARRAGALSDLARSRGLNPGFPDIAIAATAIEHELTLVTRNGRHFDGLGVTWIDPQDP